MKLQDVFFQCMVCKYNQTDLCKYKEQCKKSHNYPKIKTPLHVKEKNALKYTLNRASTTLRKMDADLGNIVYIVMKM